jgi:hypothetical protein
MHQRDVSAQAERKIFKLTMTEGQKNYLLAEERGTNEWWERLADITEISPAWLRENINGIPIGYFGRRALKDALKQNALAFDDDALFVVLPVPQKDSGVLTRLREFA